MRWLKLTTARDISVFMADSADHVTGKTGLTLTITAGKAGAAFASITPTVTERGSGWYTLSLTASHTDTLGDLAFHVTASGADPSDFVAQVVAMDFTSATLGLGAVGVTVVSPVASDGSITLTKGDDYLDADGLAIPFTFSGLPTLIGGSVKLTFRPADRAPIVYTGTVDSATAAHFDLTAAQTRVLEVGAYAYTYDVQVTFANGHVRTPQVGTVTVVQDVTP